MTAAELVAAVHAAIGRDDAVDTAEIVGLCIAELREPTVADAVAWVAEAREDAARAYDRDNHYPARDGE